MGPGFLHLILSYQMFESNMDEYLDEEVESVKQAFEVIGRDWERKVGQSFPPRYLH